MYVCRRYYSGGECPAPTTITTTLLELFVTDAFFRMLARRRRPPLAALHQAEDVVARRDEDLVRYRDSERVLRTLGEDAFLAGIKTRMNRLHMARLDQAAAKARVDMYDLPSVSEARARWPALDSLERRMIISKVVNCVFVAPGNGHIENRVTICPRGTAPARLARQGDKENRLTPVKPRDAG